MLILRHLRCASHQGLYLHFQNIGGLVQLKVLLGYRMNLAKGADNPAVNNNITALAGMQIRRAGTSQAIVRNLHSFHEAFQNTLQIIEIHIFLSIAPIQGLATTAEYCGQHGTLFRVLG